MGPQVAVHLKHLLNQIRSHDFWPAHPRPFSHRHLGRGVHLPWCRVTSSLSWLPHVRHLVSRANRLFAQCVSWCRSDRLPVHFAASLFKSYVLPSISCGLGFCLNSSPAIRLLDGALHRWGRHLLGWPSGSPNAAFFLELGRADAQHLCTERLLSLFARAPAMLCGERCPLPALIFQTALSFPGSWASHCVRLCNSLGVPIQMGAASGISLFCPLCSSLVPDSRRSSSEPILARPSCCCCFPALSLPCPCFVTCGERWSAPGRGGTFLHSFPRSFLRACS